MYDSAVGKMILSAHFWSVSTASDRYSGIVCHTGTAYSKSGLIARGGGVLNLSLGRGVPPGP